jgi:sugar lactone lactonase YvrE
VLLLARYRNRLDPKEARSRTVYAYDLTRDGNFIVNKRAIYLAQDWVPDGLKVAGNGYVCKSSFELGIVEKRLMITVTGAGKGVDIIDPSDATLLVRISTNFTVQNFAWTGEDYEDLWIVGNSGVARVKWNLAGQELK